MSAEKKLTLRGDLAASLWCHGNLTPDQAFVHADAFLAKAEDIGALVEPTPNLWEQLQPRMMGLLEAAEAAARKAVESAEQHNEALREEVERLRAELKKERLWTGGAR